MYALRRRAVAHSKMDLNANRPQPSPRRSNENR
jgi:hypothetical protein